MALSALGLAGALFLGVVVGAGFAAKARAIRGASLLYVEAVRNVPLLVHMYAWYLGFAALRLPGFVCATLGLTVYSAAYVAEIMRAGIAGVPQGQREAGAALGLSRGRVLRLVVLPQALRAVLPSLGNLASQVVKDSSLASVIAVGELAYQAGAIDGETFRTFEVYSTITVLYLMLVTVVGLGLHAAFGGRGVALADA